MHNPRAASPKPRRGIARRLGLRPPHPPMRLAKITGASQSGSLYAVAGANGRSWVEDEAHRAVHRPLVVIHPGMVSDLRQPTGWRTVRGLA